LVASATRVYGEENMATLWGSMTPVDDERLRAVDEGDRIELGGDRFLEVMYTPGHAKHLMCLIDSGTGGAFVGDAVGITLPASPPTTAAARASTRTSSPLPRTAPTTSWRRQACTAPTPTTGRPATRGRPGARRHRPIGRRGVAPGRTARAHGARRRPARRGRRARTRGAGGAAGACARCRRRPRAAVWPRRRRRGRRGRRRRRCGPRSRGRLPARPAGA